MKPELTPEELQRFLKIISEDSITLSDAYYAVKNRQ